ncbi:MAG: FHA domain-containing protein [Anaerolineales bacterium]
MNAIIVFILRIALILFAYLFTGWMGFIIYSDLRRFLTGVNKHPIPPITLISIINQEEKVNAFEKPEVVIGRDPACDYRLDDTTISLRHCKLTFHHKQWWIEDLGSTNGTLLNQAPILNPAVLTNGDELSIGRVMTSIQID